MTKKTKNIKYVIVIFILIVFILGLVIYILYDKEIILHEVDKDGVVEKSNNEKELSNKEKELLLEKIEGINKFAKYYPLTDVNTIDNQELLYKLSFMIGFGKSFSEKTMTNTIKNYFGDSYKIKHESIICSFDKEPFYVYDSDTNMYRFDINSMHGHGGSGDIREIVVNYIDGKIINDEKIIINTKLLYSTYCGDICGPNYAYFASYQDVFDGSPILGDKNDYNNELILTDGLYKSVESKLPTTTFTFIKKSNDIYNLDSVIIN